MSKSLSRGNHNGLLKNREETKHNNTKALWQQVELLHKAKPEVTWTYKEIWSGAGLKSNMALNSPWNAHIREAIETHNKLIKEGYSHNKFLETNQHRSLRDDNRYLRNQLKDMTRQRDKALQSIAFYQAERDDLEQEVKILKLKVDRLMMSR